MKGFQKLTKEEMGEIKVDTIRAHDQKANLQERITLLIKRRKKSISSIAMSTTAQSTLIKL